jgi:hypothetical protein
VGEREAGIRPAMQPLCFLREQHGIAERCWRGLRHNCAEGLGSGRRMALSHLGERSRCYAYMKSNAGHIVSSAGYMDLAA